MATTAPPETEDKPKPDGGGEEVPDRAADDPPGEKNGVIAMDDGPAKPPAVVKSDVLTREEVDELLIEAIAQARVNKRGQKDVLESVLKKSKYAPSVTLSLEVDGVEQAVHERVSVVLPKEVFSSSTAEFRELIHLAFDGLSETEKNALKTHLPKECQDEQVVHDVIRKDDFHFGNPVAMMHKMLIGGKLHPDVWLMRQKKIALQKQHYVERVRARHNALVHRMRALYRDANRRTTAKPLAPPATKKAKPVLRLNDDDSDDAAEHVVKRLPPPKRSLPKMKIEESLFLTLLDIFQSSPDKTEAFDNIVARVQQHATITDKTPENLSVSEFVEAALKLLSGPTGKLKGFLSLNSTSNRWEWNGRKPRTSQLIRRELLFLKSGAASDAEKLGDCDDSSQDEAEVKPPKAKKAKKSKSESGKIVENGTSSTGAAATGAGEAPKKESVSKKSERKVLKQPETPALPPSTPEEREEFQKQEQLRYNNPGQAFEYSINGFRTVVGPLKKPSAGSKPREHPALKSDRPAHVTFLTLVRDAASRLPGGIGTRQDVTTLFVDSQYVNPSATKEQISTVVSGALDRLRDEVDTCVKYNQERKLWQYMHKDRKIEDFEPIDWTAAPAKKKKAAPKKKAPKKDNASTSTTKSAGKTSRPTSPNIDFAAAAAAAAAASVAGDNTSHLSGMFPPGQQSPMLMPSASASAASASVSASDLLHKTYSVDSASSVSGPTIAQSFHSRFSPTHPGHPGSLLGMHEYSQQQRQLQMQQMQQSQLQHPHPHPHPHMQQLLPQRSAPQTASLPAISQIPGFGDHWVSSPVHHSPSRPDTQPFGMTGPSLVTEEEQARQNNHAAIRQALYQRQAHQQEQQLLQQQQMLQHQQFGQQVQAEAQQRALSSNQPRANPRAE